ncbi:disulfide bond formation protein B [Saccharospirillum sp.]|uniref:disulfide bond formation protein B n=1 Tax=Saccharospirillum sp. TaxID=2033801 RepID=UPI0034A009CC
MITDNHSIPWMLLLSAWFLAVVSSLSAIYIGEILGQTPCLLCWFQRAFMFPLAVILGVACFYSDFTIWRYALPLAVIGGLFASAHSLLYVGLIPQPIQPCTDTGPSCSGAEMTIFGGVPLPFLALGTFVAIIILLMLVRRRIRS